MTVHCTLEDRIALISLDDPERLNALSAALVRDTLAAVQSLQGRDVRALVVTGRGRFFCAGANIHDLHEGAWLSAQPHADNPVTLFEALATHRLPVIAALNGPALGGGFELALSCDLLVMADDAYLCTPELGLGVIANTAMARLPALVGRRRALEILCTRRKISAQEALAIGLANQTVAADQVIAQALSLARRITEGVPPGALAAVKRGLDHHQPTDWQEVRECVSRLPTAEWKEGLSAFAEKRKPDYEVFWQTERSS